MKTLKNINFIIKESFKREGFSQKIIDFILEVIREVDRKEAIKWIKEDYEQMECARGGMETMIRRWMKRLDITEEYLE